MTVLNKLIKKWESELGSYIPNAPIYKVFIKEAKEYLKEEEDQLDNAYDKGFKDAMIKYRE